MTARIIHEFCFPVVGEPDPFYLSEDGDVPTYTGDDIWGGEEPLFRTLGFVALRGSDEVASMEAVKTNPFNLQYDLVQRSIATVDGRKVNRAEFEHVKLWAQTPPKVRELMMEAYNTLHVLGGDVRESFRKSRRAVSA